VSSSGCPSLIWVGELQQSRELRQNVGDDLSLNIGVIGSDAHARSWDWHRTSWRPDWRDWHRRPSEGASCKRRRSKGSSSGHDALDYVHSLMNHDIAHVVEAIKQSWPRLRSCDVHNPGFEHNGTMLSGLATTVTWFAQRWVLPIIDRSPPPLRGEHDDFDRYPLLATRLPEPTPAKPPSAASWHEWRVAGGHVAELAQVSLDNNGPTPFWECHLAEALSRSSFAWS
jgi:hypothetical protein